ncbi:MAG: hypothetical protein K4304_12245 [Propionicimonas sp.]
MSSHRRSSIIALLATTVLALSACTAAPSPAPTPSQLSTPATPTLSATGYGALQLGMTKAEATATGLTTGISGTDGACGGAADGRLAGAPATEPTDENPYVQGTLFFSSNTGKLVVISAYGPVATPEGIKIGSTVAELKAAYPTWSGEPDDAGNPSDSGRGYVELPGGKASYRIVVISGAVVELSLDSAAQDCYE